MVRQDSGAGAYLEEARLVQQLGLQPNWRIPERLTTAAACACWMTLAIDHIHTDALAVHSLSWYSTNNSLAERHGA